MKQYTLTTAMGKRLIAKGVIKLPQIQRILKEGTLVIIAGTTNGYIAEEILTSIEQSEEFSRRGFHRGATAAPGTKMPDFEFAGDVVITDGLWQRGKTIFDVSANLKRNDVILKGANAFDSRRQAAVLVGSSEGGTIHEALKAVFGRRVEIIHPVGIEKRVFENISLLAKEMNNPGSSGPRLYPVPGDLFTELDALELLTGVKTRLVAAGGIYGAEGSAWIGVSGDAEQESKAKELILSVSQEPACEV